MGDDIAKDRTKDLRQEAILCRIKYHNTLPDLSFDPKFLNYPFESSRFVQYAATSLERNHKHELLCETDVGVVVDLIDPDVFKIDRTVLLHPDDERLLEDDDPGAMSARKSRHQRSVSWLRKTEYISTEIYNHWNKGEKVETKIGHNIKRKFNEEIVYRDRESQLNAIQSTFEAAQKPIKNHYSKPGVHAVEVLPLLPDFKLWRYPCAQVIFDDDPSRKGPSASEQNAEVNQAVIRGMVDETGDHFVVYFLPTEETKQLRRLDAENRTVFTEGVSYEYEKAREYNWNVKNKTMANYEENYFFVFRNDGKETGVYYNELETRVRLSKRRKMQQSHAGFGGEQMQPPNQSKMRLVVQHRDFTYEELQAQTTREDMLKHDSDEEEEDDDEEGSGRSPGSVGSSSEDNRPAVAQKKLIEEEVEDNADKATGRGKKVLHQSSSTDDEVGRSSDEEVEAKPPVVPQSRRPPRTAAPVVSEGEDDASSAISNSPPPKQSAAASKRHFNQRRPQHEHETSDEDSDTSELSRPTVVPLPRRRRPAAALPPKTSARKIFDDDDSDELSSLDD